MAIEMKIIDDYLPEAYQNLLQDTMLGDNFPWYLNKTTVSDNYLNVRDINVRDMQQFTHGFFNENGVVSQHYGMVSVIGYNLMLAEDINVVDVIRIKANLNTPQIKYPDNCYLPPHVDYAEPNIITCIYYVNDSDGDTIFFDSDYRTEIGRVSPKKGRLVYFDSKIPHAGCPPKKHTVRCLINFNFMVKETK